MGRTEETFSQNNEQDSSQQGQEGHCGHFVEDLEVMASLGVWILWKAKEEFYSRSCILETSAGNIYQGKMKSGNEYRNTEL